MTEEVAAKRIKTSPPLIGTHKSVDSLVPLISGCRTDSDYCSSGHFHADEALAVYLLRLLPQYKTSQLVRTRDPNLLATCDTVLDVGGEYSPDTNRYDHHQRTFGSTFPAHNTKLSSAGLIYLHFGRAIISQYTGLAEDDPNTSVLFTKLYDDFVEAIDANDNGIEVYDPKETASLSKRFNDHGVTLASMVSDLNRPFADPKTASSSTEPPADSQEAEDSRFLQASDLMGTTFLRKLSGAHKSWLPARAKVAKAYKSRFEVDPSGAIMVLPAAGIPWKEHLYVIESEDPDPEAPKVLYALYPEKEEEGSKWRVQAVSVTLSSFESRKPLKEDWRGMRDSELSAKTGIPGCVFVHASGFVGGNENKEGVLEMARQSMRA